jgi:hypothetical protein
MQMKEEIIIMKTPKIKTPNLRVVERLGAGAGHLTGVVKSTTSIGSKAKNFVTKITSDFKSGYKSTKTQSDQQSPY